MTVRLPSLPQHPASNGTFALCSREGDLYHDFDSSLQPRPRSSFLDKSASTTTELSSDDSNEDDRSEWRMWESSWRDWECDQNSPFGSTFSFKESSLLSPAPQTLSQIQPVQHTILSAPPPTQQNDNTKMSAKKTKKCKLHRKPQPNRRLYSEAPFVPGRFVGWPFFVTTSVPLNKTSRRQVQLPFLQRNLCTKRKVQVTHLQMPP